MQKTHNNLHNSHLHFHTHHPGNQDQQNHTRHPRAIHTFRLYFRPPNLSLQLNPSRHSLRLHPDPLLSWCMGCIIRLHQSSCNMTRMKDILCRSHILQCCFTCPSLYTHSESHHIGTVDLDQPKQQQELGRHPRSPSRTE